MAQRKGRVTVATAGTWALRSLVIGSSVVSVWHIAPIAWEASATNAVKLAQNTNVHFACEGIRRLSQQARWGASRRRMLLKHGAVSALVEAAAHPDAQVRDAALGALPAFSYTPHDRNPHLLQDARVPPARLVAFKQIANALVDDDCGTGCQTLWKMLLPSDVQRNIHSRNERVDQLSAALQTVQTNTETPVDESVLTQVT